MHHCRNHQSSGACKRFHLLGQLHQRVGLMPVDTKVTGYIHLARQCPVGLTAAHCKNSRLLGDSPVDGIGLESIVWENRHSVKRGIQRHVGKFIPCLTVVSPDGTRKIAVCDMAAGDNALGSRAPLGRKCEHAGSAADREVGSDLGCDIALRLGICGMNISAGIGRNTYHTRFICSINPCPYLSGG